MGESEPAETGSGGSEDSRRSEGSGGSRSMTARAKALLGSKTMRVAFVVAAVALGAFAVADQWSQVTSAFADLGAGTVAAAFAFVVLSLLCSLMVWRSLLSAAGSRVPLASAGRIFFVGQIGKYLPGAVWPVLAQMELGQAQRIPRRRSATVAIVTMLVSLVAGLLAAAAFLAAGSGGAGYAWAFLAVPVLAVGLHPRVLNPVIDRLLRLARRPPQEQPLTLRAIVTAVLWAVGYWILSGLQIWLLAVRLGAPDGRALALSIGGFAFAWCVGFLVVLAPAGAGVREAVLVAALHPVLGPGKALAIALMSRLLTTIADVLTAGIAAWYGRGRSHGAVPAQASGPERD